MPFHCIEAMGRCPKDGEVTVLMLPAVVLSFSKHQPAHCGVMSRVCNDVNP